MRISPIAGFCYNNYEQLIEMARKQSELTHTHRIGVNGAILQVIEFLSYLYLSYLLK